MANTNQADTATVVAKHEKKQLTTTQKRAKTALSWVVNIICIAIIVFSLVVAIMAIVRTTNGGLASIGGTVFMPVQSDSMSGAFEQGDMILSKVYKGDGTDLKVGQVVTYEADVEGYKGFITHRIVRIEGGTIWTKGDKYAVGNEDSPMSAKKVVATWGSTDENGNGINGKNWKGMGKMSNWLQGQNMDKGIILDPEVGKTRFFCAIVLPLILLFAAYAFFLIRTLVIGKLEAARVAATAAASNISADSLSDEDKKRLAEEYFASLQLAKGTDNVENNAVSSADNVPTEDTKSSDIEIDKK
ncbi:MAG: S26 family signal peptidase [Clostridia bacterium]